MFFFKALNRTLHRQHTQPTVIICLVHKAICRAVVSLKNDYLALTCLKYIVLLICDKCPLLRISENKDNDTKFSTLFP